MGELLGKMDESNLEFEVLKFHQLWVGQMYFGVVEGLVGEW